MELKRKELDTITKQGVAHTTVRWCGLSWCGLAWPGLQIQSGGSFDSGHGTTNDCQPDKGCHQPFLQHDEWWTSQTHAWISDQHCNVWDWVLRPPPPVSTRSEATQDVQEVGVSELVLRDDGAGVFTCDVLCGSLWWPVT